MSDKSKEGIIALEAERKVAEEKATQQRKLLALQEELKEAREKMKLLTHKTGSICNSC